MSVLLVFSRSTSIAQILSNNRNNFNTTTVISNDSNIKKNVENDSITIKYQQWTKNTMALSDSGISFFHWLNRNDVWFNSLSQYGTAQINIKFTPNFDLGFNTGLTAKKYYFFDEKNTFFYNTTRPYTSVDYFLATKQQQCIQLLHTQNINDRINFSVEYRKLTTPGFFKLSKSNHDNARATLHYGSKNRQYEAKQTFIYNQLQQDENGGILDEENLTDRIQFKNQRLIPVYVETKIGSNRSTITNYERDVKYILQHGYSFGEKLTTYSKDSTEINYQFKPHFTIQHRLKAQNYIYKYKDYIPDSMDYASINISPIQTRNDSLFSTYQLSLVGNEVSMIGNINIKKQEVRGEAGIGNQVEQIKTNYLKDYSINNYVFASLLKTSNTPNQLNIDLHSKIYFTGRYKGNFLIQGNIKKRITEKLGIMEFGFAQSNTTAPYFASHYATNYYYWENNFKNQQTTKFYATYFNEHIKVQVVAANYLLANTIYWDTLLHAKQYADIFTIQQLEIKKEWAWKKFHTYHFLLFQRTAEKNPIHVPLFSTVNQFSLETKAFKKALQFATGIEIRYNSPYLADIYLPQIYQFATQYTSTLSNTPAAAFYFNTQVNKFRASVSFNEIQQLFYKNRLNALHYAAPSMYFKFCLSWIFIN